MKMQTRIVTILCIAIVLSSCSDDNMENNSGKLNEVWRSNITSASKYVGSDNLHIYDQQLIFSGQVEDTQKNSIRSYDIDVGSLLWEYNIDYEEVDGFILYSIVQDNILVGYFSNAIIAINLDTQQEIWSVIGSPNIFTKSVPTLKDNRIYKSYLNYTDSTSAILSHDIYTGEVQVHYQLNVDNISSPVFWTNPQNGKEFKISVSTEGLLTHFKSTAYFYDEDELSFQFDSVSLMGLFNPSVRYPLIHDDHLIIPGDAFCQSYNLINKQNAWSYENDTIRHDGGSTVPIIVDNKLLLTLGASDMVCINIKDGSEIWRRSDIAFGCSLNLTYDEKKDVVLFTDNFKDKIQVLNINDGSTYYSNMDRENYNYNIVYSESNNSYYTRTDTDIIKFKID